jgi:hypothetical protein
MVRKNSRSLRLAYTQYRVVFLPRQANPVFGDRQNQ